MSTYKSRFSGIMIDRAVAYFNAIDTYGRIQQEVNVESGSSHEWEPAGSGSDYNYKYEVDLYGIARVKGAPPMVYFLDDPDGARWDLPYTFTTDNNGDHLTCYSNVALNGKIVIVSPCSYQSLPSLIYRDIDYSDSSWNEVSSSDEMYGSDGSYNLCQVLDSNGLDSVKESDYAIVTFDIDDAISGVLAPVAVTTDGGVKIYSKEDYRSGTIPTIIVISGDT